MREYIWSSQVLDRSRASADLVPLYLQCKAARPLGSRAASTCIQPIRQPRLRATLHRQSAATGSGSRTEGPACTTRGRLERPRRRRLLKSSSSV